MEVIVELVEMRDSFFESAGRVERDGERRGEGWGGNICFTFGFCS